MRSRIARGRRDTPRHNSDTVEIAVPRRLFSRARTLPFLSGVSRSHRRTRIAPAITIISSALLAFTGHHALAGGLWLYEVAARMLALLRPATARVRRMRRPC